MGDEPKALGEVSDELRARLERSRAKWDAWAKTPEGIAAAAKRAEYDARERERKAAAAHEEFARRCDARGVPGHPALRALCAAAGAELAPTEAMAAMRTALAWRAGRADRYGAPPVTLVLAGRPGNGKTAALARFVARATHGAAYVLGRTVATTAENDWSENREARERFATLPFLAIDELGLEGSDKAGPRVAALLSERHDRGLATLCATNLDCDAFVARYVTDRVVSRLANEQGAAGGAGGLPWWWDLPDRDLREPGAVAALATEARDAAE